MDIERVCQALLILEDERFVKISTVCDSWFVLMILNSTAGLGNAVHYLFQIQVYHTQHLIRDQSKKENM